MISSEVHDGWPAGAFFSLLTYGWWMGIKNVGCSWSRSGWQQEPQLHNRFLVNPFAITFGMCLCAVLPLPGQAKRAVQANLGAL